MAVFHVFVEGATDATPAGVAKLADAIAKHYGLPSADLLARLRKGRVRVKANADRATAEQYKRDLERLGARCTLEDPTKPQFQSGLSAAFSDNAQAASLGALDRDDIAFSLASVDGGDEAPLTSANEHLFAPPPEAKPPDHAPLDRFTPPQAQDEELRVDIASDDLDVVRERSTTPPPAEPAEPVVRIRKSGPVATPPRPVSAQVPRPASQPIAIVARERRLGPLGEPRARFAVGVLLAILLGFVPAHVVAAMREHSADTEIDSKVRAVQELADSPETYATLDRMRATQLARKKSERRSAAVIAFAIWALVGGGIAFVWFRKIPWER